MKVIKFESKESKKHSESIKAVLEEIKNCTQFLFVYSDDNLDSTKVINGNSTILQSIGMLDLAKHLFLHEGYDGANDDDDDLAEIPSERIL